jgi:hypothetical protein
MRRAFLNLLIVIAVVCGSHAPVLAHDGHEHFGEAGEHAMAVEMLHDDASAPAKDSPDPAQQALHHHHCQIAMAEACTADAAPPFVKRDVLRPGADRALPSRALSPPLDPPIA